MTETETLAILTRACEAVGLSADGARLLRLGSNAVYRLGAPVVARVARPEADFMSARRTVAAARWLESSGYPAVRPLHLDQPVVIDDRAVTFWEAVSDDGEQYATTAEAARVIARLHQMSAPDDLNLPDFAPFAEARRRISGSQWLTADDRTWMTTELARLRTGYARLDFPLPHGVIHGDASVGNVVRDYHGQPVVTDLDDIASGPREWDLIQTAIYYDRFGWHTREEYEAFTRVYGFDVMQWPGYSLLAAVREFTMVVWTVSKADEDGRISAEARKRLNALRAGTSRRDWNPI